MITKNFIADLEVIRNSLEIKAGYMRDAVDSLTYQIEDIEESMLSFDNLLRELKYDCEEKEK